MTPLTDIISNIIRAEGPITLERYMDLALHHPVYGYYSHRDPLGERGDFVTAPEVSQMFSEIVGVWLVEMWRALGKPDPFILLELGPGHGTLLRDLLRATVKVDGFQKAMRLHLFECNSVLRGLQIDKLSGYSLVYLEGLDQLPALPVLVVANEFFDTIPMRQFVATNAGWRETLVGLQGDQLVFLRGPIRDHFSLPEASSKEKREFVYEVSLQSMAIMNFLSAHIMRHSGAFLIVDYGYAEHDGVSTLEAIRLHKFEDPLANPGVADVTANIDFIALGRLAERLGACVRGPVGQGEFLRAMGIELRAAQLRHTARHQIANINGDLQRLIDPAHMGVAFKAMAVASPKIQDIPGFS